MESLPRIYQASPSEKPATVALQQGEIVSGLIQTHLSLTALTEGRILVEQKFHPYAIVLTQDCDLTQDFNKRNQSPPDITLPSILFCEATSAETMKTKVDARTWRDVPKNKVERYHFLQKIKVSDDSKGEEIVELGLDFKRYFTIPTDEVYLRIARGETIRRSILVSPYLEHLSSRFSYFLSRVALVRDHESE